MSLDRESTWYKPQSEIVFGVSAAVGTPIDDVESLLKDIVTTSFSYDFNTVRITSILEEAPELQSHIDDSCEYNRLRTLMDAGDNARKRGTNDILARFAISRIAELRKEPPSPLGRTCHVIRSLKHPDEVELLRMVYGNGFFLLGVFSSEKERIAHLQHNGNMNHEQAMELWTSQGSVDTS